MFKDPFKNEVFQVMEYVQGTEILDQIALMGQLYSESDAK